MKRDNATPDMFGKPTAQDKYDARQRLAAHWMPVIRAILNTPSRAAGEQR